MDPQLQQSGIFVLVIFLAVLAERGWQSVRRRRARSWPAVEGRVHSADWRQPRTGTNRYFIGTIAYFYLVGGQFFSGYHRRSFSSAEAAAEWARRMTGAQVVIRHHARIPERSVLLEDEQQLFAEAALVPESDMVAAGD